MDSRTGPDGGDPPPWLDAHPNYLNVRTPASGSRAERRVRPWLDATLGHLLGVVVSTVTAFGLGFLGILAALALGVTSAASAVATGIVVGTVVLAGSQVAGILATAWYVRLRRGRRPLLASFVSAAAAWLVGTVSGPVHLPLVAQLLLGTAVAVSVLAVMIGQRD